MVKRARVSAKSRRSRPARGARRASTHSRKRSAQLTRHDSSFLEKRAEIEPVMHLEGRQEVRRGVTESEVRPHLSQHMEVKVWIEACILALACSFSRNSESSLCGRRSEAACRDGSARFELALSASSARDRVYLRSLVKALHGRGGGGHGC